MSMLLDYANVITPVETLKRAAVVIGDDGKIVYVGPMESAPRAHGPRLDLRGLIVAPGLIDIHVHGGHGITFGKPESLADDLIAYSNWVIETGVTGFLTTITASNPEELAQVIQSMVDLFEAGLPGAQALGFHLEGPFLNPEKKGAQNPDWIRNPTIDESELYLDAGKGWIRQMTMSPELPHANEVAALYRGAGVCLAIGHSAADYETAVHAMNGNWTHITHTFNAQTGLHHREPGIVGGILGSEEITAELIADMIHVHPAAMKVLVRCLGADRVVLVTDAMAGAGLSDGEYELLGFKLTVRDGKATQADGTIAGSTAMLNHCVRNMHDEVGIPLADAIKMATINPARVIGETARRGSLQVGKQADLIVVDKELNVYLTMVKGKVAFTQL